MTIAPSRRVRLADLDVPYPEVEVSDQPRPSSRRLRLADHRWPAIVAAVFVVVGMGYMFGWAPIVEHRTGWITGGDLWGIWRGAHYVGWGSLGSVYDPSTGVIAFPGMEVLLAPLAMASGPLHLSESFPPFWTPHPTVALIVQPIELVLASTLIFAADAMARRLEVAQRHRIWLCLVVATIAWPTAALWGHAEDCLAATLALYAMIAAVDGRWKACGWLFGLAIAFQPLAALVVPLFVGASPTGQRLFLVARSVVISAVLVVLAFASDASDTFRALVKQPTPPSVNHATPWASLAPRVPVHLPSKLNNTSLVFHTGHWKEHIAHPSARAVVLVSGGAGRSIDVALALLIGVVVWRRPQSAERLIWLAAMVLASRCFFEAVMTPYYVVPPLVLTLVLASHRGARRLGAASLIALELLVFSYFHLNPWAWWLPIIVGLTVLLGLGYPSRQGTPGDADAEGRSSQTEATHLAPTSPVEFSGSDARTPEPVG